ncbi:hypothetical protein K490DRAFT_32132 [Saccharata proteae CBS 121410]|uniref:PHD-type domain-containing protein n=1 Tax=Saccharata proteae CBS 121410 TaxID=1314787 RepID=A0A9P4I2W5_9PEZI|nr:hypothetical protein K490DRAFT_32132 [Saccharata proteae CBS 121410]
MSFKLSELLNPAPSSGPPSPKAQSPPPSAAPLAEKPATPSAQPFAAQSSQQHPHPVESIQAAASSLTALAQSEPSYRTVPGSAWNNHQYGESAGYGDAQRTSSLGSFVSPVEPSQQIERSQHSAPSLDQYHHGSKSPEEQRRQSILSMPSDSNRLAPIHPSSLPVMMHDHPQPERSSAPDTLTSPPPQIKPEPAVLSREPTLAQASIQPEQVKPPDQDHETLKANGRPSPTPSSRTSKTPGAKSIKGTPIAGSSPAPQSSPPPQDDEVESGSDDGIYCICRKGDNHTWMIACDGPCQDWYHGTCVKVREEDEELIEKYFCPQCTEAGEGRTTWKRMCRRQGCRRPAQRDKQSKYCSDECGVRFFKDLASGLRGGSPLTAPKSRTRRKANQTDNTGNEDDEDEEWTGPRGGVLSVRDLKAMADEANDVNDFKNLGNSMLSPPNTASPTQTTFKPEINGTNGETATETAADANPTTVPATYTLDAAETTRIETLTAETARLQERIVHFKDKERFIAMSREAAGRYAEREGIKVKDICGYDGRLAWSDGEFARWRTSKRGRTALHLGTLEPPSPERENCGETEVEVEEPEDDKTMCTKKRCGKHHQWLKIATQDAQFEIILAKQQLATLEAEEKDIRERAMMRWRSEKIEGERNREGWVEVLDE